jgi:hypothetical protein
MTIFAESIAYTCTILVHRVSSSVASIALLCSDSVHGTVIIATGRPVPGVHHEGDIVSKLRITAVFQKFPRNEGHL